MALHWKRNPSESLGNFKANPDTTSIVSEGKFFEFLTRKITDMSIVEELFQGELSNILNVEYELEGWHTVGTYHSNTEAMKAAEKIDANPPKLRAGKRWY